MSAEDRWSWQHLCDEVYHLGGMLACFVIDFNSGVRGENYGEIQMDAQLKGSFGKIAATIWNDLRKAESIGGPLKMVMATYKNLKVVGIPVPGTDVGLLLAIPLELDAEVLRERVIEFLRFWLMGKLDAAPDSLRGK